MVCAYCSGPTEVVNSRLQRENNAVWRRRHCKVCDAIFTTHEQADLPTTLMVSSIGSSPTPFSRDKLFLSILRSCGHRADSIQDAGSLAKTIIASMPTPDEGLILREDLAKRAHEVLLRFDNAAATHYEAYHPSTIS